ncbi:hypothetical protein V5799_005702 [Amblyomma americanum]|uniref:Cytochrome n=1 Tax=Amblyomma americanum TaxID=6943 RepID=A0AAQ4DYH5_AMBAM
MLVAKIDQKAQTGEEFEAGEMYAALALDVICKSAMGIDYNLQEQPRHRFLVCCRLLFGCAFSFIAVLLKTSSGGNQSAFSKGVLDDDDITQNAFNVLVAGFVTREAVVDKQYDKIRIPAGTAIMAASEYIHRDPRHWDEPEKFNPDRFMPENKSKINPMAMQAFGNGPRNCIGMRFAQIELRYTFAHILRKYRLEKTENSEKSCAFRLGRQPCVHNVGAGRCHRCPPRRPLAASPVKAYREWLDKYGDVVGYYNGYRPVILVADLELLKQIQIKDFQDFTDRGMSPGIISAVEKLVSKIDRKAQTGEEFEAGEMYAALALDVVCKSAMGIDYNLQDHPHHGFLVCCRMLFGCAFSVIAVLLSESEATA